MNRKEFFSVAKITKAPIVVKQDGENGYSLSMVHIDGDQTTEYTLLYQGNPRYFKSLSGVETTLRDNNLYNFSVQMQKADIAKRPRTKAEE